MTGINDRTVFKLSELNLRVQSVIYENFPDNIWVIAEISEIKVNAAGHCYLELIEKDSDTDRIRAKARATIWSFTFRILKSYFETTTGYRLSQGIKILISVKVEFHEIYGYSLNITDIDPTYTLGDIEKKRKEIISRLEKEGVIHMNKELSLALVPQKVAIISSETAAGYKDFVDQLENNPYGYKFYHHLFSSVMQGDQAEASIIRTLDKIFKYEHFFDVVVVIRGGGSKSDLSTFDNYNIAYHITQFPLPVLTGIGHEQDDTITDMVAHTKLKTPTAVAEFLISRVNEFELMLQNSESRVIRLSSSFLGQNQRNLDSIKQLVTSVIRVMMQRQTDELIYLSGNSGSAARRVIDNIHNKTKLLIQKLLLSGRNYINIKTLFVKNIISSLTGILRNSLETNKNHLNLFCQRSTDLDPARIFERGFSITLFNGKPLRDITPVKQGDIIKTSLKNGQLDSEVRRIYKHNV